VITLAIVIVSWNVRELLRRCLHATTESLANSGIDYQIFVVDNASVDGTPAMLQQDFPAVRLIEAGQNLGFAAGNNLALRSLVGDRGQGTGHRGDSLTLTPFAQAKWVARRGEASAPLRAPVPSYVLLLNPDTEPVGDAIPSLLRELESRPQLVAVGPQLRYADGSVQPSRRRFPTRQTLLWESTPLEQLWPANPWARRYRCDDAPASVAQPVGWLVGAALLVRTAAIKRAGLLDERFFMYTEELEWQRRLQQGDVEGEPEPTEGDRTLTSKIWYLPQAVVIHHEGKSSEQALAGRYIHFSRSKLLLARMWFGWGFAALLRAFLRAGFVYELAVEGLKLRLNHRPELRRQRIAVYREVLGALRQHA
jgi:N-acetylglucosaminyl-diphospho-decaprenol L-rhamnosyltransferase